MDDDYSIECILDVKALPQSEWRKLLSLPQYNTQWVTRGSMWEMDDSYWNSDKPDNIIRALVKWKRISYMHLSWELEDDLATLYRAGGKGNTSEDYFVLMDRYMDYYSRSIPLFTSTSLPIGARIPPANFSINAVIDYVVGDPLVEHSACVPIEGVHGSNTSISVLWNGIFPKKNFYDPWKPALNNGDSDSSGSDDKANKCNNDLLNLSRTRKGMDYTCCSFEDLCDIQLQHISYVTKLKEFIANRNKYQELDDIRKRSHSKMSACDNAPFEMGFDDENERESLESLLSRDKSSLNFMNNNIITDYQWEGVKWLLGKVKDDDAPPFSSITSSVAGDSRLLRRFGKGCILADAHGLGKYTQIFAFLGLTRRLDRRVGQKYRSNNPSITSSGHVLFIVPDSIMNKLAFSFESWTGAKPLLYYGSSIDKCIFRDHYFTSNKSRSKSPSSATDESFKDCELKAEYVFMSFESVQDFEHIHLLNYDIIIIDSSYVGRLNNFANLEILDRFINVNLWILVGSAPVEYLLAKRASATELETALSADETLRSYVHFLGLTTPRLPIESLMKQMFDAHECKKAILTASICDGLILSRTRNDILISVSSCSMTSIRPLGDTNNSGEDVGVVNLPKKIVLLTELLDYTDNQATESIHILLRNERVFAEYWESRSISSSGNSSCPRLLEVFDQLRLCAIDSNCVYHNSRRRQSGVYGEIQYLNNMVKVSENVQIPNTNSYNNLGRNLIAMDLNDLLLNSCKLQYLHKYLNKIITKRRESMRIVIISKYLSVVETLASFLRLRMVNFYTVMFSSPMSTISSTITDFISGNGLGDNNNNEFDLNILIMQVEPDIKFTSILFPILHKLHIIFVFDGVIDNTNMTCCDTTNIGSAFGSTNVNELDIINTIMNYDLYYRSLSLKEREAIAFRAESDTKLKIIRLVTKSSPEEVMMEKMRDLDVVQNIKDVSIGAHNWKAVDNRIKYTLGVLSSRPSWIHNFSDFINFFNICIAKVCPIGANFSILSNQFPATLKFYSKQAGVYHEINEKNPEWLQVALTQKLFAHGGKSDSSILVENSRMFMKEIITVCRERELALRPRLISYNRQQAEKLVSHHIAMSQELGFRAVVNKWFRSSGNNMLDTYPMKSLSQCYMLSAENALLDFVERLKTKLFNKTIKVSRAPVFLEFDRVSDAFDESSYHIYGNSHCSWDKGFVDSLIYGLTNGGFLNWECVKSLAKLKYTTEVPSDRSSMDLDGLKLRLVNSNKRLASISLELVTAVIVVGLSAPSSDDVAVEYANEAAFVGTDGVGVEADAVVEAKVDKLCKRWIFARYLRCIVNTLAAIHSDHGSVSNGKSHRCAHCWNHYIDSFDQRLSAYGSPDMFGTSGIYRSAMAIGESSDLVVLACDGDGEDRVPDFELNRVFAKYLRSSLRNFNLNLCILRKFKKVDSFQSFFRYLNCLFAVRLLYSINLGSALSTGGRTGMSYINRLLTSNARCLSLGRVMLGQGLMFGNQDMWFLQKALDMGFPAFTKMNPNFITINWYMGTFPPELMPNILGLADVEDLTCRLFYIVDVLTFPRVGEARPGRDSITVSGFIKNNFYKSYLFFNFGSSIEHCIIRVLTKFGYPHLILSKMAPKIPHFNKLILTIEDFMLVCNLCLRDIYSAEVFRKCLDDVVCGLSVHTAPPKCDTSLYTCVLMHPNNSKLLCTNLMEYIDRIRLLYVMKLPSIPDILHMSLRYAISLPSYWTIFHTKNFLIGVLFHGWGQWSEILVDPELDLQSKKQSHTTNVFNSEAIAEHRQISIPQLEFIAYYCSHSLLHALLPSSFALKSMPPAQNFIKFFDAYDRLPKSLEELGEFILRSQQSQNYA